MPRRRRAADRALQDATRQFLRLPRSYQIALVILAVIGIAVWFAVTQIPRSPYEGQPTVTGTNPDGSGTYHFCFWNVENLFDDQDDPRRPIDEEFDNPFAQDADLRRLKYDRIADALLRMNGGKGPDVIACVEVENIRAAELLRDTLNRKLEEANADPVWKYTQVAMRNLDAGRHIAPCVITRLNVDHTRTRLHGSRLRILETRLSANGHPLEVITSHWTSQLRGGEEGREKYAQIIADRFNEMARSDPAVDLVVCGDFNDTPEADTVTQLLRATGDRSRVLPTADQPFLLNLMFGKPPDRYGTLWYRGKPMIYDQVCISPGMLQPDGWSCDPESVRTVTAGLTAPGATRREPWRYGGPATPPTGGRGYSDHFPVTVTLTVAPPGGWTPRPD
jgi:endonuclease/exonuclease/phosphatase family metal-dependent hydrolase